MKVKTWVETEVEVDVSVEEAMAELCAMPDVNSRQDLVFVLNRCVAALRHVPDAALAGLEAKTRQIVADALRQQALRYDPGLALTRGEPVNATSTA
jgi:hypothetical protein